MRSLRLPRSLLFLGLIPLVFCQCAAGKSTSGDPVPEGVTDDGRSDPVPKSPGRGESPAGGAMPMPMPMTPSRGVLLDAAPPPSGPAGVDPTPSVVVPDGDPNRSVDARADARPLADARIGSGTTLAPDAFFGASRCQRGNMMFCEDFESGKLDPDVWSLSQTKAATTVESMRAARGKNALHVTINEPTFEGYHLGFITSKRSFAIAGGPLFIRAFVYIDAISTHRHFNVFTASTYKVNVLPTWNPPYLPASYRMLWQMPGGGSEPKAVEGRPSTKTPLGRWACWEWEIQGAKNEMGLWIDDQEAVGLRVGASLGWTAPGMARLGFGMEQYHAVTPGFGLWIDEIAVSTEKIGCAP